MALLEHITCGLTSIAAPTDNVEEAINQLSNVNPRTRKTGFQQQFEVYKSHCVLSRSFNFYRILEGIVSKNKTLSMKQQGHQRMWTRIVLRSSYHVKNINYRIQIYLFILDTADTARVIVPQLDGYSDYINFCYIDVSIYQHTYAPTCVIRDTWYVHAGLSSFQNIFGRTRTHAINSWRFLDNVMEKKSHTIVMLGELVENEEVASSSVHEHV